MVRFGNGGLNVLVLRDADELGDTLRQALDAADAAERPGLERAMELIAEHAALTDSELRVRWVRRALAGTDVAMDEETDQVSVVRALRKAEPELGLATAVRLANEAFGRTD